MIPEIDAKSLVALQESGKALFLLDVREPHEADLCKIEGSTLIPLGQIPLRLGEIPGDLTIVAYCHHGRRSERALQFLESQGFNDLHNLAGGIDAWAVEIDTEMTRY